MKKNELTTILKSELNKINTELTVEGLTEREITALEENKKQIENDIEFINK